MTDPDTLAQRAHDIAYQAAKEADGWMPRGTEDLITAPFERAILKILRRESATFAEGAEAMREASIKAVDDEEELEGEPSQEVYDAMASISPTENARAATRATKKSIRLRISTLPIPAPNQLQTPPDRNPAATGASKGGPSATARLAVEEPPTDNQPRSADAVGGADFNAGRAHERAKVVAWLRRRAPHDGPNSYTRVSDALQRGDHDTPLPGGTSGGEAKQLRDLAAKLHDLITMHPAGAEADRAIDFVRDHLQLLAGYHEQTRRLAAARTPLPKDDGWRPISEAHKGDPDDKKHGGPDYLLYGSLDHAPGYYREIGRWYRTSWAVSWQAGHGDPTHFRELPPPPQEPSE